MHRPCFGIIFSFVTFAMCVPVQSQHIVAHRGASFDAPENTLAAIRTAWQQGADAIEADFQLSSDGHVVCIHDKETERVSGEKLIVADTTFDKLRRLDVGAWKGPQWRGEQMPSLQEVLAAIPMDKMVVIELKTGAEIVKPMMLAIEASDVSIDRILVISFEEDSIAECERQVPQLRTHWLSGYRENEDGRITPSADEVIATLRRIGADGFGSQARVDHFDGKFVEQLRQNGYGEFHVWTVNDPRVAKFYKTLGAWSVTTDRPRWLRARLAESK